MNQPSTIRLEDLDVEYELGKYLGLANRTP